MRIEYNKLVRDNILQIIAADNHTPTSHIATEEEYREKLYTKLSEEAAELTEEPSLKEASHVLEVLHAICELEGWSLEDLEKTRQSELAKRGGFSERIILEYVD